MKTVVGNSIKRLEDPRLLRGGGRYVDDVVRPGMAHAVIVRSAHAHARLARVDLGPALAHPGVLGGVTGVDVGDVSTIPLRSGARASLTPFLQTPIARDRVRYAGEPLAVLVAICRLFVGVHWPSDIVGGALYGTVVAFAVHYTSRAVFKRRKPQRRPAPTSANVESGTGKPIGR